VFLGNGGGGGKQITSSPGLVKTDYSRMMNIWCDGWNRICAVVIPLRRTRHGWEGNIEMGVEYGCGLN